MDAYKNWLYVKLSNKSLLYIFYLEMGSHKPGLGGAFSGPTFTYCIFLTIHTYLQYICMIWNTCFISIIDPWLHSQGHKWGAGGLGGAFISSKKLNQLLHAPFNRWVIAWSMYVNICMNIIFFQFTIFRIIKGTIFRKINFVWGGSQDPP